MRNTVAIIRMVPVTFHIDKIGIALRTIGDTKKTLMRFQIAYSIGVCSNGLFILMLLAAKKRSTGATTAMQRKCHHFVKFRSIIPRVNVPAMAAAKIPNAPF